MSNEFMVAFQQGGPQSDMGKKNTVLVKINDVPIPMIIQKP